jgi:hypothetical protein
MTFITPNGAEPKEKGGWSLWDSAALRVGVAEIEPTASTV